MPLTVAHISDLHLDPGRPTAAENLNAIRASLTEQRPDILVVTGDLTDDGWKSPELLTRARASVHELAHAIGEVPFLVIPGNHDVGNFRGFGHEEVTAGQVDAYREVMDADRFDATFDRWRLIGIDSMMLGSGLDAEEQQFGWLEQVVGDAADADQHVLFCSHAPLFIQSPGEPAGIIHDYWVPRPAARDRLLEILDWPNVIATISGHVHQGLIEPTRAWCPPASGVFVQTEQFPQRPDWDRPGYLIHELTDDAKVETTHVALPLHTELYRADET